MPNKPTYRLFEDKIDKLVHDAFVNETVHTTQHEWQSLQQRLQDYKKQPAHTIYKYLAVVAICTTLIISLLFLQKNNKNNTPATKNEATNTFPINNNSTLNEVAPQKTITTENNFPIQNNSVPFKDIETKFLHQDNANTQIAVKKISTTNTTAPQKKFKQKKELSAAPFGKNDWEDNNTILPENDFPAKEDFTQDTKSIAPQLLKETPTVTISENSTETDHLKGLHTTTYKPLPQVTTTKKQRNRKEVPQHDFSNEVKFYIEAHSGLTNSTKDKNSFAIFLAPKGLIDKRLNQEYAITTANAGVNFKLSKNHFLFSSGLSYLQFGDKVNYDSSVAGVMGLNANGKSSFTYLEIPVLAGYDWAYKRWGLNLQGGLSMGVLLNTSGQYLSSSNIVVPQNITYTIFDLKKNQATFKKSVFNLIVNPQLNYFINNNTNFFISPVYRRNLQPITATDSEIKQKYNSFGINFGLRTRVK